MRLRAKLPALRQALILVSALRGLTVVIWADQALRWI